MSKAHGFCVGLLLGVLAPVAAHGAGTCADKISVEGSFIGGRTLKGSEDFANVKAVDAYRRAYALVVKTGLKIDNADKDMTMFSASQEMTSLDRHNRPPFNFIAEEKGQEGSRVSLSFAFPGSVVISRGNIEKLFCGVFAAVSGE